MKMEFVKNRLIEYNMKQEKTPEQKKEVVEENAFAVPNSKRVKNCNWKKNEQVDSKEQNDEDYDDKCFFCGRKGHQKRNGFHYLKKQQQEKSKTECQANNAENVEKFVFVACD